MLIFVFRLDIGVENSKPAEENTREVGFFFIFFLIQKHSVPAMHKTVLEKTTSPSEVY